MSPVRTTETIVLRGACPHDCPDTCATLVEVQDGRAIGFRGDPDHPVTQGWLCAKVRPYLDRVYSPDRLQAIGPDHEGRIASRVVPGLVVDPAVVFCVLE